MGIRMNQDSLFASSEGDSWYRRNRALLAKDDKIDWPLFILDMLGDKGAIASVLELGCSNGFRLHKLKQSHLRHARCVGIDASAEAIATGMELYPDLELQQGVLATPPISGQFDLVIVNYVLHWIDRTTLARSVCSIDAFIKDGGLLLVGDFLPDYPQRRRYHHLPEQQVFTYKQDYPAIFTSLGLYKELARFTYDHDSHDSYTLRAAQSPSRGVCALLYKSSTGYYPEV
jgi:SAM-dependent methyltransferase